jgi:hypothetical protein
MRGRLASGKGSGGAFAVLLALVLLSRLLVPSGYMVGATAAGATGLVLCGPASPATPDPHRGHGPGHEAPAEPPCPYAALAAPDLPPSPPVQPAAPMPDPPPQPTVALEAARPAPAAPPPPATGPPVPA